MTYLFDANVFIEAYQPHYAFEVAPVSGIGVQRSEVAEPKFTIAPSSER